MKSVKMFIYGALTTALILGCITVYATSLISGRDVSYDGTTSGLEAVSVNDAIDKIYYMANNSAKNGELRLDIKKYSNPSELESTSNEYTIAVITPQDINGYYVSNDAPENPTTGLIWIQSSFKSQYKIKSIYNTINITAIYQYDGSKWMLRESYYYDTEWHALNYVADIKVVSLSVSAGTSSSYEVLYTGTYEINLIGGRGGSGGSGDNYGAGSYGKGGQVKMSCYLNAGDTITVAAGGAGGNGSRDTAGSAGYNGGSSGGGRSGSEPHWCGQGGGGGGKTTLNSANYGLLAEAYGGGGGGGGGDDSYACRGGSGGAGGGGTSGGGGGQYGSGGNGANGTYKISNSICTLISGVNGYSTSAGSATVDLTRIGS